MTIRLQSPGDDNSRVVITDERPGTPPGERTVVAECHVYSGSTATFEVPVIQDPDPDDRETLSVSGGGEVIHYNPVIVDWRNFEEELLGYQALVPNGIVPPNHNKLLGLPHILNHPDPTNLILPTQ